MFCYVGGGYYDDGKTIKLTDSVNGPMEIKNLSVFGIDSAQKEEVAVEKSLPLSILDFGRPT